MIVRIAAAHSRVLARTRHIRRRIIPLSHPSRYSLGYGITLLLLIITLPVAAFAQDVRPLVPWIDHAAFVLNTDLSDEFDGTELNLTRWDEHGLRNPNSECPRWNGPTNEAFPDYSTFFPSTTHPSKKNKKVRLHKVQDGSLDLTLVEKKLSFFKKREYYCDANTFTCNFDSNIPCYQTNIFGEAVINETTGAYRGINHDKCKIDPYCIPHYKYVNNETERTYRKYASTHLSSRKLMHYGFLETRVWLPKAPIVVAVWMHDDDWTGKTFCRYKKAEGNPGVRQECPSAIRSRRWQEIDMLEQMNSELHKLGYTPNIHVFAGNKGEYTAADAKPVADGSDTGGGPLIVNRVFEQNVPSFDDVPDSERISNYWQWRPGIVGNVSTEWADGWRTVGLYWSPQEIRFYVDGVEMRRLENYLVHQPMFLDISHALNVNWAEQFPTDDEIGLWAKVDYVRVWDVQMLNVNEFDPPSSNELSPVMRNKFDDRYGRNLLDVFDRFPYHDELTVLPEDVRRRSTDTANVNNTKQPASSTSRSSDYFEGPLTGTQFSSDASILWKKVNIEADEPITSDDIHKGYIGPPTMMKKRKKKNNKNVKTPRSSTKHPRPYKPKTRGPVTEQEKRAAYADEARNAAVWRDDSDNLVVEVVKDGCRTSFEHVCANDDLGPPHQYS